MRIVFFGTPTYAARTLRSLVAGGHDVVLVVTQPDRRRGRGSATSPTPVGAAAAELGLPVSHRAADAATVEADLGVLVAYGRLIRQDVLDVLTIVNLHPSLLPRWRGATPVESAILAGDERTGICLMQLAAEMDAGPVYARAEMAIDPDDTAASLYDRLFARGDEMLLELLASGLPVPQPQEGEATYCGKVTVEDFHIDWTRPAVDVARLSRVGKPWTTFDGKRLLVLEAVDVPPPPSLSQVPGTVDGDVVRCGTATALQLRTVQPEGKRPLPAADWSRGLRTSVITLGS